VNARHQARSVGNTGENCAGANLLPGANRDFLEDSFHAGANKERLSLLAEQIVERLHLRDFGLFGDQLGLARFFGNAEFLAFDFQARGKRIGAGA
jgi:hypothetical protein